LDATHISRVNSDEMVGDILKQLHAEFSASNVDLSSFKFQPFMFNVACAREREREVPL